VVSDAMPMQCNAMPLHAIHLPGFH
jgi:hypothetical protein